MNTPGQSTTPPPASNAELDQLRAEVAQLQSQLAAQQAAGTESDTKSSAGSSGGHFSHRLRAIVAFFLGLVTVLLTPFAVVAVWQRTVLTDTDAYVATVAPIAEDPEVQEAVTARLSEALFEAIDVQALTTEALTALTESTDLPPNVENSLLALTRPISSGIESFVTDRVADVVSSDVLAVAWAESNRVAHEALTAALSGEVDGALAITDGKVYLDLAPVLEAAQEALVSAGFSIAENIPSIETQFLLYEAEELGFAQQIYGFLDTLGFVMPIIAIALALATIMLANSARFALMWLGVGMSISMLLLAAAVAAGERVLLDVLPSGSNREAVSAVYDALAAQLRESMRATALMALLVAIGALLAGPSRLGTSVRGLWSKAAVKTRSGLEGLGLNLAAVHDWVEAKTSLLRAVSIVAAFAILLLPNQVSPAVVAWTAVGLVVVLFVIQVLASPLSEPSASGEPPAEEGASSSESAPAVVG